MNDDQQLFKHSTISELVNVWQESKADIIKGYAMLHRARERLETYFEGGRLHLRTVERPDYEKPDEILKRWEAGVFSAFIARMGLREILSLKKLNQLDNDIEQCQNIPDITFESLATIANAAMNDMGDMLQEKVAEVYDWLRPEGMSRDKYKTNQKSAFAGVGDKIVITWALDRWGRTFKVAHRCADRFRALDQVFHLLAGQRVYEMSYQGELADAIDKCTPELNVAHTKFFEGKCFRNGNLHLRFKRLDLLEEFNLVAGGLNIQDSRP